LTSRRVPRYDACRGRGGTAIPSDESTDVVDRGYDFERLEHAVAALVEQHERMQKQNGTLRAELSDRGERIRVLEAQVLDANQRRRDVTKRIDELIEQIDQLDAQLESLEAGS
jgi:chromosome segregation ATPase